MRQRPFKQVDVFTGTPYFGNPLGVVLDGKDLSTEDMQRFTDWTNLSECAFLLPPTDDGRAGGADYRVRIFCPGRELPCAGHPTRGSCHAGLESGGQPRADHVVQECGVGLVRIRRDGERLAFAAPPLRRSGPLDEADVALIARGLGIDRSEVLAHAWCENGPPWRAVMLRSAEQVLAARVDATLLGDMEIGLVAPQETGADSAFEVRAFFRSHQGLAEDPVTGSLNAALAQWLIGAGLAPDRYVAAQGTAMGRAGRVHIEREGSETIWVGGGSVTCIDGRVTL